MTAAGLPEPTMVNGVQQSPMEGTSMLYTFDEPTRPDRHDLQYFEMFGNRGIYHKGWSAVTKHRTPWVMVGGACPRSTTTCGSSTTATRLQPGPDLAAESPTARQLQRLWLIEATKYNVLPIDDRARRRLNPDIAGRPTLIRGNTHSSSRHGATVGEQRRRHQEQVVLGDRRGRRPRRPRQRRDHRPGWSFRWPGCVPPPRLPHLLL